MYAHPRALNRRQAVQRLLGSAAGAGLALPAARAARSYPASSANIDVAHQEPASAGWEPQFLDAHQCETLTVLAERIVPNSTQAGVTRFLDALIAVDSPENQKKFLAALSAFDHEAITRYNAPFKALTEDQQHAILTAASTAPPGQPAEGGGRRRRRRPGPAKNNGEPVLTLRDHFEDIKGWVSTAFYSSEVGLKELGWTGQVAWDSYAGCQHPGGHSAR